MKVGKLLFILIVFMFPVYIVSAQLGEQEPEYENLTSPVDWRRLTTTMPQPGVLLYLTTQIAIINIIKPICEYIK